MSGDQAYYWTEEWQAGERESMAAFARGEGRTFDNVEDAIAWLLSDEDDG